MRDYLVMGIIFGSLPFCFFKPFFGILVWSWISYMNPHRLAWSLFRFQAAQYVAIPTLLGLFFTKDRQKLPLERETVLMLLLWIFFTFTTFYALYPSDAWRQWDKVSKIFLITFVTLVLCTNRQKLRYLFLTIAFSLGFYGFKGGIFSIATGGAYKIWGPERTFIGGNNEIALALLMTVPILYFLGREEKNKLLRIVLLAACFLSVISIVFTYSRGGFLGLVAVGGFFLLKAKKIFQGAIISLAAAGVALSFAPEEWFNRMQSIQNYEEDMSATMRLTAWSCAWNLVLDRPFTGGGFETFGGKSEVYAKYAPDAIKPTDIHSIYFEILGEHGFVAFGLFIALFISSFLSLRKLKRTSKDIPSLQWVGNYCDMLELSLLGYMVCGVFLGLAYFDLVYHLIASVILLKVLARREQEALIQDEMSFSKP
jgi:probable O-glycosylation ligase (exosortase A-associated)